jgi:hypothetical protein
MPGIAEADPDSSNDALIDSLTLPDPRTNPVPIQSIISGGPDTLIHCVEGTFCGVAIKEIN